MVTQPDANKKLLLTAYFTYSLFLCYKHNQCTCINVCLFCCCCCCSSVRSFGIFLFHNSNILRYKCIHATNRLLIIRFVLGSFPFNCTTTTVKIYYTIISSISAAEKSIFTKSGLRALSGSLLCAFILTSFHI